VPESATTAVQTSVKQDASAAQDAAAERDASAERDAISAVLTMLRVTRVLERIDAGISPQQYRILKMIGAGGERSARLAEKLAVARPTLTSIGDSLVAGGLATRQAEAGDRRVVRLCLTPAGQAALERADGAYAAWFGEVLDHFGQRAEILAAVRLVDDAMTERRQARHAADRDTAAHDTASHDSAAENSAGQR
jgi:DNA-binding MarR family transcriptional regulator